MDSARPTNANNLLSLKQASEKLGVTKEVLLSLNEYNILKPTITLTGEIGYAQDQINNFLAIQQLSAQGRITDSQSHSDAQSSQQSTFRSEISNYQPQIIPQTTPLHPQVNQSPPTKRPIDQNSYVFKNKIKSFISISSLSFLFFLSIFVITTKQDHTKTPNNSQLTSYREETSSDSGFDSSASPIPTINQDETNTSKNSNIESLDNLNESKTPLSQAFESKNINTSTENKLAKDTDLPLPDIRNKSETKSAKKEFNSFASKPSCPTCATEDADNKSIFDSEGNIKGEQPKQTNLLAATSFGTPKADQIDNLARPHTNPVVFLGISIAGLLAMMFIFRNQIVYAFNKSGSADTKHDSYMAIKEPQKILEVSQKTDGTVVVHILGKEHKVSKPELDSESDQFIARLMELAENNIKEIDYDTLLDESIRSNAPLSKLVTRLGFVGIKRDLFFPRTSKNKVLFRKYITEQDLIAMSLTTEQISNYM